MLLGRGRKPQDLTANLLRVKEGAGADRGCWAKPVRPYHRQEPGQPIRERTLLQARLPVFPHPASRVPAYRGAPRRSRGASNIGGYGGPYRGPPCSLVAETRGADPARLRDVDHDPVGAVVLHFDVAARPATVADAEGLVDVGTGLRPGRGQPLGDRFQALDLEPDVVDAAPALATLDPGHRVALEVQDRQVEVAVAEVVALGSRPVELGDLFHAEHVHVELGGRVHVLG